MNVRIVLIFFVCGSIACNHSPSSKSPTDSATDTAYDTIEDAITDGTEGIQDIVTDAGPSEGDLGADTADSPDCVDQCAAHQACGDAVVQACVRSCDGTDAGLCEQACMTDINPSGPEVCAELKACFGVLEPLGGFNTGPYGTGPREIAGPFSLPTLGRSLDFESVWNGRESFVFILKQTGWEYAESLWQSDIFGWLRDSPDNVHYVMMGYPHQDAAGNLVDDVAAIVTDLKDRVDEKLIKIGNAYGKARECHWRRHIHFVTTQAWGVGGWIQDKLQAQGSLAFAIDRFQAVRNVGLLSMVNQSPVFGHTRYEAEYFNFEWDREQSLAKEDVSEVMLFDNEKTGGAKLTVELPSADAMANFDTLEIDLGSYCAEHDEANCGEWDYKASLALLEMPVQEENPHAQTPCQGAIPGAEATPGVCNDGQACQSDVDCADEGPCTGAVEATDPVAADELVCECSVPGGGVRESKHTCLEDGSGFGDCACNQSLEVARWITTYGREGRWVSDQSQLLPLFKAGGKHRFHYKPGNPYVTRLSLRFRNAGKEQRPTQLIPLFKGGSFNPTYNSKYEPLSVAVPASAKRAEIFAYITGHGWGAEKANCAEFCNHTHHFTLDGEEFVFEQPWVGNNYGCAAQVPMGTVPNQYGTWTLGRAGWCPGMDVKPFVADVTASMTPGADVTVSYKGLFEGADYQPEPSGSGQGFGAQITMSSWLVLYE